MTFFVSDLVTEFPQVCKVLTALRRLVAHNNIVISGDGSLWGLNFVTIKEALVHIQRLYFSGLMDYLSAEISTSKQKKFSLVTFVDTPGLVDGDMIYPFDVNSAITWLGVSLNHRPLL